MTDIIDIPLNKLTAWRGNVRKTNPRAGLDQLKASITAHGLLQSLVVRETKLPHAVLWRPRLHVCALRPGRLCVSFLREPALSQVSSGSDRTLAGASSLPSAPVSLLPGHLYAACPASFTGTRPSEDRLQPSAPLCRPVPAQTRR